MAGFGVCDFRVVGDHLGGVNVPNAGGGRRPAGSGGVYGTMIRLVIDEEREDVCGVSRRDEEPGAFVATVVFVERYSGAGDADGVG